MGNTRDEILAVAGDLFIEQGYDKTSLREIAEGVGVTKAALYYHFPSKIEILGALVAPAFEILSSLASRWKEVLDPTGWEELLTDLIDWMLSHQQLFVLIDRSMPTIEAIGHDYEHFQSHTEFHQQFEDLLADATLPAELRLRVVSAIGAATAIFTLGGRAPEDVPIEFVRSVLVDVVRDILQTAPLDAPAPIDTPAPA